MNAVIAYHAIFTTYGTWVPNDPRGSFSKEIYNAALRELGRIRYGRQDPQPPRGELRWFWRAAAPKLSRPPYFLNDSTCPAVAGAFRDVVQRLGLTVRACAIMNDHVHVLSVRSKHKIEYVVGQLKGAATHALGLEQTPWARGCWKVFLDDQNALYAAAEYIERNPVAAGMAPQRWDFITPLGERVV